MTMKTAVLQSHTPVVLYMFRAFQGFRFLCYYGRLTEHITVAIKAQDTMISILRLCLLLMFMEYYQVHLSHISSLAFSQRHFIHESTTNICVTDENVCDVSTPLVGVARLDSSGLAIDTLEYVCMYVCLSVCHIRLLSFSQQLEVNTLLPFLLSVASKSS